MLFRLPTWPQAAADFLKEWDDRNNHIFRLNTSGTTGTSKRIALSREQITAAAYSSKIPLGWKEGQRIGLALNASGIGGKMVLVRGRCYNMEIIPLELQIYPYRNSRSTAQLEEWTGYLDHLSLVPVQALALLKYWAQHQIDPGTRVGTLLLGGGPLPADLERFLVEDSPWNAHTSPSSFQIIQGLGMTETAGHFALRKLFPVFETAYTPLPGIRIRLEPLQPAAPSGRGTLVITGAVTNHQPLATREIVRPGPQTGQIEWLGRADLVIQSGGHTLLVDELEETIGRLLSVPENSVAQTAWKFMSQTRWYLAPATDPVWGERVTLCIPGEVFEILAGTGVLNLLKPADWSTILPPSSWPRAIAPVPRECFDQPGKVSRLSPPVTGLPDWVLLE
jgi:O-succinylbenzoic acid--CoA ligase